MSDNRRSSSGQLISLFINIDIEIQNVVNTLCVCYMESHILQTIKMKLDRPRHKFKIKFWLFWVILGFDNIVKTEM